LEGQSFVIKNVHQSTFSVIFPLVFFFVFIYFHFNEDFFFLYNACSRKLNFLMSNRRGENEREVNERTTSEYKTKYFAVLFNSWIISLNILQSNMNSSALIFLFISYVYSSTANPSFSSYFFSPLPLVHYSKMKIPFYK